MLWTVSMETVFALFTAGLASFVIVPLMMRLAPRFGMVDQPEARKVHTYPIPRVGGWGIAAGVVFAVLLWAPVDRLVLSYIWGIVVLFLFGAWDDRSELGHYTKFVGQLIAVLPIVVVAGLYVTRFPFIGEGVIPSTMAMVFTVVAMMGMTNAINHSDGLDGLAGGEAILSLVAFAFLAHQADGGLAVLIAVAVIGGVFGFLRYNTHPAVVFMGDSGSQVIGFSLGILAVLLVERVDLTLSPAAVVLILGLPVADILFVFYRRIREGRNWFRATKNHVHHRLIERRFTHPEAVVIIYGIQIFFVASGLVFRHASDWLLVGIYLAGCVVVFGGLQLAESRGWYAPQRGEERGAWRWLGRGKRKKFVLVELPRRTLELAVPAYLVVVSGTATDVPKMMAFGAFALLVLLAAVQRGLFGDKTATWRRLAVGGVGALMVYLGLAHSGIPTGWMQVGQYSFFAVVALSVIVAVRYSPMRRRAEFRTTGLDYLIALVAVVIWLATSLQLTEPGVFLIGLLIMLYALQLMTTERRERSQYLGAACALSLGIVILRALI